MSTPVPDDPERLWLSTVRRAGERELTPRAIVAGILIGAVLCVSNIYVFARVGWSFSVTLTAAILAFSLFRGLSAVGLTKTPLTALENNALTTVASGAGYMTGGGNMAAFGALLMVTAVRPDALSMSLWFGVIAALGVFAAIPVKRRSATGPPGGGVRLRAEHRGRGAARPGGALRGG